MKKLFSVIVYEDDNGKDLLLMHKIFELDASVNYKIIDVLEHATDELYRDSGKVIDGKSI